MGSLTKVTCLLIDYICKSFPNARDTLKRTIGHFFSSIVYSSNKKSVYTKLISPKSLEMGLEHICVMETLDIIDLWVEA